MEYIRLLEKWKTSTQPIRVIISDCDFNLAMSIDKLTRKHREGGQGCVLHPGAVRVPLSEYPGSKDGVPAAERHQRAEQRSNTQTAPKSRTVVAGDVCGTRQEVTSAATAPQYTKIYEANKGTIKWGATPTLIKTWTEAGDPMSYELNAGGSSWPRSSKKVTWSGDSKQVRPGAGIHGTTRTATAPKVNINEGDQVLLEDGLLFSGPGL